MYKKLRSIMSKKNEGDYNKSPNLCFLMLLFLSILILYNSPHLKCADVEVYDFIAHAPDASWSSGAGPLPFPGSPDDSRGFARYVDKAQLEDGSYLERVLETHPQWVSQGYIMGSYPIQSISAGLKIKVKVGFLYGATGTDGVTFEVRFLDKQQNLFTLVRIDAKYDQKLDSAVVDLSQLAGKSGTFILYVKAGKESGRDWAVWTEAKIEGASLPDLIVSDILWEQGLIYYKIKNVGDASVGGAVAPAKFTNVLVIDGKEVARDYFTGTIESGQTVTKSFDYQWQPTPGTNLIKVCVDWEGSVVEKDEQNNCLEKTMTFLPDLTPLSISTLPAVPTVGEDVVFTVQIKNVGNTTSGTCKGALTVDKLVKAYADIPNIKPGETKSVTLRWAPESEGTVEVTFSTDFEKSINEIREDNNDFKILLNVLPPPKKPDLVPSAITWSPLVPTADRTLTLRPRIQNIGEAASPSCIIELHVNGTKVASKSIPSIPAGSSLPESAEVVFSWTPSQAGVYRLELLVDADGVVNEIEEGNNLLEVFIEVGSADITPPSVTIFHTDAYPTERDLVRFCASASDPNGIAMIVIYVNGMAVKTCYNTTSCEYVGGPYPRRSTVFYAAQAYDNAGNVQLTPNYNFTVRSYYTEPLLVNITIHPADPTELDEVTFDANASYPYGIQVLRIYLNGVKAKEVFNSTSCSVKRGPWSPGYTVQYYAEAYSVDGDYVRTPVKNFTVAALGRDNVRNMSAYTYKDMEVFIISDQDWRAVLSAVPIAVWGDIRSTQTYPLLIYHYEEGGGFDADAVYAFLNQYSGYGIKIDKIHVTFLGEPPRDLYNYVTGALSSGGLHIEARVLSGNAITESETELRLSISPSIVGMFRTSYAARWGIPPTIPEGSTTGTMPSKDIFSLEAERQIRSEYWTNISTYVISEDEYSTGLMAAVYASYINAPLLFQGHYDVSELRYKNVRLIGDFSDSEVRALERENVRVLSRWTLEELQRNYVIMTGTSKFILVNPLDLWIGRNASYMPELCSASIYDLYSKHSLAAPFLAAAKKEVIIETTSTSYVEVDQFVKQSLESLHHGSGTKYLTIVASPEVIPIARPNLPYAPSLVGRLLYYQASPMIDVDIACYDLGLRRFLGYVNSSAHVQYNPVASEYIVAWVDEDTWGDIWYRDLRTGRDYRLTGAGEDLAGQSNPAVYGTRIVWQDGRNYDKSGFDLYMYDADSGRMEKVVEMQSSQERPAIWRNWIVWQDNVNGNWDIFVKNIETGSFFILGATPNDQMKPSIWENRIVYEDTRNGDLEIYMSSIADPSHIVETRITNDRRVQCNPHIYGDRIVWQDNRNGDWDIYMYDLSTSSERRITFDSIDQIRPNIWEDKIAWLERGEDGWWYVCVYDVNTGISERVARTEVSADDGPLWLEVDGRYYGSTENLGHQDIPTGRIYGLTVSDVSAYIARDVFYDSIPKNRDALVIVREDHQIGITNATDEADLENYARTHYWTQEVEREFSNVYFFSGHSEVANKQTSIISNYTICSLVIFVDHGSLHGFEGAMDSSWLRQRQLMPATVLDIGCLTGGYYALATLGNPADLFSAQNIRHGTMVFMGATDVSYWHCMFDDILNGVYLQGKTIGEAYMEARNEDYDEDIFNFSNLKGDIYYALLGDPTFRPKWW